MREILFRAKRKDDNVWEYGDLEHNGHGKPKWVNGQEVDPSTVGQYTGLTDKNGKKIFEGDIVLKRTHRGKRKFPVSFDGGMFHCGYGGGSSTATHGYTLEDRQIEVIGNIWDNPELLGGADNGK